MSEDAKNHPTFLNDFINLTQDNAEHANMGEDGVILKALEILGEQDRWSVEIGAWDGKLGSNTINLVKDHDYSAVLVEGHPEKFKKLEEEWKDHPKVFGIHAYVETTGAKSLDNLFRKTDLPKNFDFLSIDIDGNDYHLWSSLEHYRPKLVVIEFNPTIPNEVDFVQEDDFRLNQGSSPAAIVRLGQEKGYELVCCTYNNLYLVDKKYYEKFNIGDNRLSSMRQDLSRVTYIFNGYDGTVFIRGHGKIDLHNVPYIEKKFQILPEFLRGYDDGASGKPGSLKRMLRRTFRSLKKRNVF